MNESGKTNLMLPLWKLNPAGGGALQPTSDYPKSLFVMIRNAPDQFEFITAEFETGIEATALADLADIPVDTARRISVARLYDGNYRVGFPDHQSDRGGCIQRALAALRTAQDDLAADPKEEDSAADARAVLGKLIDNFDEQQDVTFNELRLARNAVAALIPEDPPAVSHVVSILRRLHVVLDKAVAELYRPDPGSRDDVHAAVIARLPRFVYYSNYGNLDSEIYLPHVVENMNRGDLGAKESAKARTLRVLFDFVGVQAKEILELGRDFRDLRDEAEALMIEEQGRTGLLRSLWARARGHEDTPDPALLAQISEAKRTRSILLQSAGAKLTGRFSEWWKQGDYQFRFEADGNHFRIWVADARRPQEVELEHRSTGLQWFLSFFLVFLHEAKGEHDNCVLLLDEPGHSLHPLAQRDLSAFFEGLSENNQIIYTTHSPFLVDADRLARARKVFVDRDGSTRVSSDLLDTEGNDTKKGAGYAIRAALNLAVAEASLGGAKPVLVPGRVEQIYLSVIRTVCIASGQFQPRRDMIFAPACDAQVVKMMARLLSDADACPPRLMIDDALPTQDLDGMGIAGQTAIRISDFGGLTGATIEDLIQPNDMAVMMDRVERRPEKLFADCIVAGQPFRRQVLDWAKSQDIVLASDWRTQLAERMRKWLLGKDDPRVSEETLSRWLALMQALDAA
ncbi:ATP-dependent nuclease [Octadecabacter antarcticus]|uniref:ATP-dependent nuclease n=1 Tax=Octadecabacter antarcticus TaxID=1217908 RepID=UPI001FE0C2C9|nr:AAA family ATPase [Octadecabacter antarcticus]